MILSVVTGVASSYVNLRGLDMQLEISKATAESYYETQRIFELRHRYGTVSQLEVAQVESQYQEARAAIPVFEARVAAQENLLGGGARAVKGPGDGELLEARKGARDFMGLVEPAPLLASPVEGDRDEHPVVPPGDARIIEGLGGEGPELAIEVDAPSVFEGMDEFPGLAPRAQGGAGEVEVEAQVLAVRAGEAVGDVAIGGQSALLAERGGDPRELVVAGGAQVAAVGQWFLAKLTGGWIEKIEGPSE